MADKSCETCAFRGRYEKNPRSLLGRLWRWHSKWCPGWRGYMKSLSEEERATVREHLETLDKQRTG